MVHNTNAIIDDRITFRTKSVLVVSLLNIGLLLVRTPLPPSSVEAVATVARLTIPVF